MDPGRLVEFETHDELMARPGAYAEMYDLSRAGYLAGTRPPTG
jgi:ABC-type multidrug transport system fused ATPase/permease subunit